MQTGKRSIVTFKFPTLESYTNRRPFSPISTEYSVFYKMVLKQLWSKIYIRNVKRVFTKPLPHSLSLPLSVPDYLIRISVVFTLSFSLFNFLRKYSLSYNQIPLLFTFTLNVFCSLEPNIPVNVFRNQALRPNLATIFGCNYKIYNVSSFRDKFSARRTPYFCSSSSSVGVAVLYKSFSYILPS